MLSHVTPVLFALYIMRGDLTVFQHRILLAPYNCTYAQEMWFPSVETVSGISTIFLNYFFLSLLRKNTAKE